MTVEQDSFEAKRAKRQKAIKKKRRKRFFIAFLLLLIAVGIVLSLTVFFKIKNVSAKGSKLYSEKEITAAADIKEENLFLLSSEDVTEKIRSKLPFVQSVEIKRSLPESVTLKITDAKEYCYYSANGKYYTISKSGYVLKEYAEPPPLLEIVCSKLKCVPGKKINIKNKTESELVKKLTEKFEKQSISASRIDVSNIVAISAVVDGRFEVNFGNTEYLDEKIVRLKSTIENIGEGRRGKINLSVYTPKNGEWIFNEEKE